VSVLDQEEAKKFLKGKPEDKYRFFMKATELERIDVMYSATLETVQTLTCNHEKMKSAIANEQEQVDNLRKKVDELQAVEKMEDKLDDLKTKYAWSLYHDFDAAHKTSIKVCLLRRVHFTLVPAFMIVP
jgi:DNA repair exonuclease SbcCD ATPase subunit